MDHEPMVKPGTKVRLADHDPSYSGEYKKTGPETQSHLDEDIQSMAALQEKLYAESKQALLIVLQAMDAAGKDGTIKHVMTAFNPQACNVASFKAPTPQDLSHDFLWRVHQHVQAKGEVTIFNRSHYEDVLVVRVHKLAPEKVWKKRFEQINEFEELLVESGTRVLKFFLHISKEEQLARFRDRVNDPTKHWKLSPTDMPERELWDDYVAAFEETFTRTSTKVAPWYIVPANAKWYRNLVVADIVEKTLREMDPQWPEPKVDVSKIVLK